ncbi:MAG TPA: cupin domain-containing protein [Cyclobacteriaceae bacterium]|nr:cupin domain-containing protein [Cyclobacteriaceae bacterium]
MKRRLFLQLPLAATAFAADAQASQTTPSQKPFKVTAGKDRFQEELNIMGGQFHCKVSSKDTNGALLIYDTYRQQKGGPAYHFHHEQDEWFYVMKGEFIVKVGEETFNLKAGDSAFAPRKIPHAFAMTSEGEGQMMVLFQPAGTMEHFFAEMAKLGTSIPKDQETKLKELWASHGMQIVGPPLKVS